MSSLSNFKSFLTILAVSLTLSACQTANQHARNVQAANNSEDQLTVGKVQREIRIGMSSSDVVMVLGSPNMVTTDSQRRENWVYDKVSTERVFSESRGGVNLLVLGAGGGAGASSTSQRTLTIVIKFGSDHLVRDFAYRYSSF